MAQYDITQTMAKYLDRHMVLQLLEHLQDSKLYPASDILCSKLELGAQTKMVDLMIKNYKELYGVDTVPEQLTKLKADTLQKIQDDKATWEKLYDILNDEELVAELQRDGNFNMGYLTAAYGVKEEDLDSLYSYARLMFDIAQYGKSQSYLSHFMLLSKDEEKKFWALWGRLASSILADQLSEAHEDLEQLAEALDKRKSVDHLEQLQQRTWLLHWSLFILLNLKNGFGLLYKFFTQEKLLNAIQTNCPHLLRYLTASVILKNDYSSKKEEKHARKDLVRTLQAEKDQYSDPVTEFLLAIHVDFDFELAHTKLKECRVLMEHDYFLKFVQEDFLTAARQMVFDTYCRVHRCIDIPTLVAQLDINEKDAEPAIVQLIRDSGVDAKIDSNKNQVVMIRQAYNQVDEKTKYLGLRTKQLVAHMDKKYSEMY